MFSVKKPLYHNKKINLAFKKKNEKKQFLIEFYFVMFSGKREREKVCCYLFFFFNFQTRQTRNHLQHNLISFYRNSRQLQQ